MDANDPQDGQDPSNQDPANAPGDNGEGNGADAGAQDVKQLPEWAQKRLQGAEGALSDLKQTAGAKSVKELKEKLGKKPDAPAPKAQEGDVDQQNVTREEIALFNKGYSPEELAVARSLKPGVKVSAALEDPTVKAAIGGIREANKTHQQIPEPSSRIPVVGGKSFRDMKPDEQKANYGKTFDTLLQKGRGRGGRNVGS